MSVLVKGMAMPKDCLYCCMCVDTINGESICNFTGDNIEQPEIRNKNCPLVELPPKHGRLIDGDAVIENRFKNPISYNAFKNLIERQMTVIKAEDE